MALGVVREIWRFPVKSMQGGRLSSARVSVTGIQGDRAWAMRDEARQEVQWGKKYPQLMQCQAVYLEEPGGEGAAPVAITFPDGETVRSDAPAVHEHLSRLIEGKASLWPIQPAENKGFYRRYKPDAAQFQQEMADAFAREPGEPLPDLAQFPEVLMDYVSVPGTFFDNEAIHLMTTASLSHMQGLDPDASWDVRRFRPNFLIETPTGISGLAENAWIGKRIRLGQVILEISAPTPRCGMTVRAQGDLGFDRMILRNIVRHADQCLGVGAHCREAGEVHEGDAVELLD